MLRAVGMTDADFAKPQIGVASSWNEITPCNLSLDRLAKAAKDGVHAAGGFRIEFGTSASPSASPWATSGMQHSAGLREVIADIGRDSHVRPSELDGSVLLAGCDKSLPGC
jgi:dihydroxy-acid dehydratase